ncbi:MAG: hypothetical protein ACYTGZ_00910 [Planctomycetota bacterium]|jgi:hypothetical protein
MKYVTPTLLVLALLLLATAVPAQDESKEPDPAKILNDLTAANAAKDVTMISGLLDGISHVGKTAKDNKLTDPLAKELVVSFKLCKGNWGTLRKILDAMGDLRSKKSLSLLKKTAFQKKTKSEDYEKLQIHAIAALGAYQESKLIDPIGDQTKHKSTKVAAAAYAAFKNYGASKGKVRKKVAELLMKRLESEYPFSTSPDGNAPGAEAQKRWGELQKPIVASLQAVCHETTINDIENWREWWKENKKSSKTWKDKKRAKP